MAARISRRSLPHDQELILKTHGQNRFLRTKSISGRWVTHVTNVTDRGYDDWGLFFVSQYVYRWFKLLLVLFCVFSPRLSRDLTSAGTGIHIIQNTPDPLHWAGVSTEHNGLDFLILFLNILSLFLEMLDLEQQTNKVILTRSGASVTFSQWLCVNSHISGRGSQDM